MPLRQPSNDSSSDEEYEAIFLVFCISFSSFLQHIYRVFQKKVYDSIYDS